MVPLVVLFLLGLIVAVPLVAVRRQAPEERSVLVRVMAVALGLRVVLALVLHLTGAWQLTGRGAITPDESTVDLAARLLVLGDDRSPLTLGGSLHTSWLLLSWSLYELVWNDLLVMKLLNTVLGTLLVVPAYLMARELHSLRSARMAAWAVALFPTTIVWSALALRETLLALLLLTLLLLAVRAVPAERASRAGVVLLAVSALALLVFTRSYMFPLLAGVLVVAGALRAGSRRRPSELLVPLAAVLLATSVIAVLPTGGETLRVTYALVAEPAGNIYNPLSGCEESQDCPSVDPGSGAASGRGATLPGAGVAPPRTGQTSGGDPAADDPASSLQSVREKGLVRAFAIALLAGRPVWRTTEFFFLLQPGVVLWWALLPLIAVGGLVLGRRRRWDGVVATAGYSLAVVLFLAYTGQFIRHHFMIEPACLVLAAVGWGRLRAGAPEPRFRVLRPVVVVATGLMALGALGSVALSLRAGSAEPSAASCPPWVCSDAPAGGPRSVGSATFVPQAEEQFAP